MIKRFKARGGVKTRLPKTMGELLAMGRSVLKIDCIKVRIELINSESILNVVGT